MQAGRWYTFRQTVTWTSINILIFVTYSSIVTALYFFLDWTWIVIPWQPISLVGIAVAFYLGFKNNSSYERLWEARKIWGGIVNSARSFTVMSRDFITNEHANEKLPDDQLWQVHKRVVHRHLAWIHALAIQLRKLQPWEHNNKQDQRFRKAAGLEYSDEQFEKIRHFLSDKEFQYMMSKGNRASHILSLQSLEMRELKAKGLIEDFRHMELQNMISEFYDYQGKSERIKNFPFPRQYASTNLYFVMIFLLLLPLSMLGIISQFYTGAFVWLTVPFTALVSWVFWMMEAIGEYSENPFEGLYNDVPITQIATSIEIDIRQMLEEEDLPDPIQPLGELKILY